MCSMDSRFLFLCCIFLLFSRQRPNPAKREERAILRTSFWVSLCISHHISKCFHAEMRVRQSVRLDRVPISTGFSSACRRSCSNQEGQNAYFHVFSHFQTEFSKVIRKK